MRARPVERGVACRPCRDSDSIGSASGCNRLSTTKPPLLGVCTREPLPSQEIDRLRAAGIDDINLDLIPARLRRIQTRQSWSESIAQAIAIGVPHLSVYMLDVDEDSRLGREIIAGGTRYGVGMVPGMRPPSPTCIPKPVNSLRPRDSRSMRFPTSRVQDIGHSII